MNDFILAIYIHKIVFFSMDRNLILIILGILGVAAIEAVLLVGCCL